MAIGDMTPYSGIGATAIQLLAATSAVNGAPSGAEAGLAVERIIEKRIEIYDRVPEDVALVLFSTAGSGTMTCTARLWSYHPIGAGYWLPCGTGTGADKGKINATSAIDETGTDTIRHQEVIQLLKLAGTRLYLEITAIGVATTVQAHLVVSQQR